MRVGLARVERPLLESHKTPRPHNNFVSEEPEVDADIRVDGLQKLLAVAFRAVNVAADGVTGHFRGGKWDKDLFQIRRS